jgi:hypothetical protein
VFAKLVAQRQQRFGERNGVTGLEMSMASQQDASRVGVLWPQMIRSVLWHRAVNHVVFLSCDEVEASCRKLCR